MDTRKNEKTTALIIVVLLIGLSLFCSADWNSVGIYAGCHLHSRLLYSLFHVNILHALLNAWCLLSLIFIYDISIGRLLISYGIAITIPIDTLGCVISSMSVPTVGLSAVVFVLFGTISFEVQRKWYYQMWMSLYILVGFIFPNTNAWLHLYCYIAGLALALLNKPIKMRSNNV
ncbi:MAG: rhomboid family intramembrane serine protease [Muribaculaceae bacterium]